MKHDARSEHTLIVYACAGGHAFFHRHRRCPACGERLREKGVSNRAALISHTVVRVNPRGKPYRLGIARVENGAKTLCLIDGEVPAQENPIVLLHRRGRLFRAVADDGQSAAADRSARG